MTNSKKKTHVSNDKFTVDKHMYYFDYVITHTDTYIL